MKYHTTHLRRPLRHVRSSLGYGRRIWGLLGLLGCLLLSLLPQQAALANNGAAPNVLSLPAGPGSLGGVGENVQANLNMGLMSYSISVVMPKGRGQATPGINISYSSSAGASLMGIGWNFGAGGAVERLTVRGLPTYTNNDHFYSGGELVKIPGKTVYRARNEGGFVRYQWKQSSTTDQKGYWLAEYPDGSKAYYGANAKGELDLNAQVSGVKGTFKWHLVTKVDRNGNRIEYSYFKLGAQVYMDTISWVFDNNNKALYQTKFKYEDRPDPISDGKPGFDLRTEKRINELVITSAGTRFRSYTFTYEDATGLSRLTQVKRFGRDGTSMYPTFYTMKYTDATFSPETSQMVTMKTSLGIDFGTRNADFVDVNGDGLPDVVDTSNPKHIFHMNMMSVDQTLKQTTHDFSQKKENPTETSARLSSPSVQMIDYNGDGFTDMVDAVNKQIYLNKGKGRWEAQSQSLQNFPVTGKDPNMRFMDYNGDKMIDVISTDGGVVTFWVADGKGNWVQTQGKTTIGLGFAKDKLRLIDMNGDGLMDFVHINKDTLRYRKYLGYGEWSQWINANVPEMDKYELDTKAQFNDINGDGLADMVAFFGNEIVYFVNKNGVDFKKGQRLTSFKGIDIPDSSKVEVRIVDINGNGSRDIVWINSSGQVTYLELFAQRPNLMTEISNGIGQRINVEYGSSVNYFVRDRDCNKDQDVACAGPWQNKMPMAFTVVTKITTWASRSTTPLTQATPDKGEKPIVQQIYYHNGFYDGKEKKFRGFRKVENVQLGDATAQSLKEVLEYNVGDTDTYLHGLLLRKNSTNGAGVTYFDQTNTYEDCPVSLGGVDGKTLVPPVRYICQTKTSQLVKEGVTDPSKWVTIEKRSSFDGYGNVVSTLNTGAIDVKDDEKLTQTTYITPQDPNDPTALWMLRYPKSRKFCNEDASRCIETRYYYDGPDFTGLPLGQVERGNLTRSETQLQVGGSEYNPNTAARFDTYGNITGQQSPMGLIRDVTWDATYSRFPTTETINLPKRKLTMKTNWDYALSAIKTSEDFQGNVSEYRYDVFGRLLSTLQAGDAADAPSATYEYKLQAPISQIISRSRSQVGGPLDRLNIQCFDGMGRKFATATQIGPESYLIGGQQDYNSRGSVWRTWDMYTSKTPCQFAPPETQKPKVSHYDGLGRRIKLVNQDGTFSSKTYGILRVETRDEEDNNKDSAHYNTPEITVLDGLGQTVEKIQSLAGGQMITTTYKYNVVSAGGSSQMIQVTFHDGSTKSQTFDALGRLLKITDPDRGEITQSFDLDGNMLKRKEADGVTIVRTYDLLKRNLSYQQEGKDETKISFTYDAPVPGYPEATNTKGKLTSIQYPKGARYLSYDGRGNATSVRVLLNGHTFDFKGTYNNLNQLVEQTYPDGRTLTRQYDQMGRLIQVGDKIKSITYGANGYVSAYTLGNGNTVKYSFDVRRRLESIDFGNKVLKLGFTYDGRSNITSINKTVDGTSNKATYGYDALSRLINTTLPGETQETITYAYDALHNLTARTSTLGSKSKIHLPSMKYDATKIHAVTQANGKNISYDKVGCMQKKGAMSFNWDYMRRQKEVMLDGKVVAKHWYGQGGARLVKSENDKQTYYVTDEYEIRDGQAIIYVMLNNDKIAAWKSSQKMPSLYADLSPAAGDKTLTAKPDGVINASDAWIYQAGKEQLVTIKMPENPMGLNMVKDMLAHSAAKMLDAKEDITHYYHPDQVGNVLAVTDAKGEVISRKAYYPYGTLRSQQGAVFSFGYMGTEKDRLSGMNYFNNRFMDTSLGRWQSPDPLFDRIISTNDEFNSYGVVMGNPLRKRDITGNNSEDFEKQVALLAVIGGVWGLVKTARRVVTVLGGRSSFKKEGIKSIGSLAMTAASIGVGFAQYASDGKNLGLAAAMFAVAGMIDSITSTVSAINNIKTVNESRQFRNEGKINNTRNRAIASITGSVTQGIALMTAGAAFAFDGKTESILLGISGAATLTTLALKVGLKGTAKNVQAYKAAGGGRGGVKAFLFGGLQRRTSIGGTTIQFEAGGNKIGRSKSLVPNKINKK